MPQYSYWDRLRLKQNHSIIYKQAQDLVRKNLVPDHVKSYLLDLNNIKADAHNRIKDRVKNISCPKCGIELASRFLMRNHMKQCYQTEKKYKENETITGDFKPYFY